MYNILADLDDLTESMEAASEKGISYVEDDDCKSIYEDLLRFFWRYRGSPYALPYRSPLRYWISPHLSGYQNTSTSNNY